MCSQLFNCTKVIHLTKCCFTILSPLLLYFQIELNHFSKIQLVVYYQCCILIG